MALDMFYNGKAWNNEDLEHGAGREAAFNYMLALLRDDDETGGRYFVSKTNYSTKLTAQAHKERWLRDAG